MTRREHRNVRELLQAEIDDQDYHDWRRESDIWEEVYNTGAEMRRRRKKMPGKLRLLGIHKTDRNAAILDLCCGSGEALDTLYEMGFRNLSGMDIVIPKTLESDPRFKICVGDARKTEYAAASYDWVLNIHAMHHLGMPEDIEQFLAESYRILKPGGRLSIIDFPNSLQIRLAFWWFRQNLFLWTPYLKNFGMVIQEEWHFLKMYLPQWARVRDLLYDGRFEVVSEKRSLFYFYLTLKKSTDN